MAAPIPRVPPVTRAMAVMVVQASIQDCWTGRVRSPRTDEWLCREPWRTLECRSQRRPTSENTNSCVKMRAVHLEGRAWQGPDPPDSPSASSLRPAVHEQHCGRDRSRSDRSVAPDEDGDVGVFVLPWRSPTIGVIGLRFGVAIATWLACSRPGRLLRVFSTLPHADFHPRETAH